MLLRKLCPEFRDKHIFKYRIRIFCLRGGWARKREIVSAFRASFLFFHKRGAFSAVSAGAEKAAGAQEVGKCCEAVDRFFGFGRHGKAFFFGAAHIFLRICAWLSFCDKYNAASVARGKRVYAYFPRCCIKSCFVLGFVEYRPNRAASFRRFVIKTLCAYIKTIHILLCEEYFKFFLIYQCEFQIDHLLCIVCLYYIP